MESQVFPSLNPEQIRIRDAARLYMQQKVQEHQDARLVLHDDRLADYLVETVALLGQHEDAAKDDVYLAQLAAIFYPLGFRLDYTHPLAQSQAQAKSFLQGADVPGEVVEDVLRSLEDAFQRRGRSLSGALLLDALAGLYCHDETQQWSALQDLEKDLLEGPRGRLEKAQLRLQELLNLHFFTSSGRRHWQTRLGQQLLEQKQRVEKLLRNQSRPEATVDQSDTSSYGGIENDPPVRAAQTFFRAIYRNHINLSAIADNKANIMISVNAIMISVLITFLSYRNIAETQPMILLPVIIFLVAGLASLVFAVLSARPKVTALNAEANVGDQSKRNLAFFGNFVSLDLTTYEESMQEVLRDGNLLYGNMVRDLYYLGKVLDQKYRYLSISYNIFMVGLVITVALFLFTLFAS